jgi:hypothetical protein
MNARKLLIQIIWGKLNENCHCRTDLSFELMNYQGFQNNQVNFYKFFRLGMQAQSKI